MATPRTFTLRDYTAAFFRLIRVRDLLLVILCLLYTSTVAAQILGFYKAARVQVSQIYDIDTSSTLKMALLVEGEWVVGIAEQNPHRSARPEQPFALRTVSYTHLDVYKRQAQYSSRAMVVTRPRCSNSQGAMVAVL